MNSESRTHGVATDVGPGKQCDTPKNSRGSWFSGTPHMAKMKAQEIEEEDVPVLRLTYFTKKVMVCFDTVRTGTSRTRELLVENPCDFTQELCLEKFPRDKGFFIDDTVWEVDGCETIRIPITWTPKEEGSAREMVTFKCEEAFRLQVILLGTAEDPPKRGPGRRSTFSVHRKVPLKVTQSKASLKPSRPTMILKPKAQKPRHSVGKTGKENCENQAPVDRIKDQKSVKRWMTTSEVDEVKDPQIVLGTPSPQSICEKSPAYDFVALDSSLAEINRGGMPITAEDLLLENVKRQTLSVCRGMSPLLQMAKPCPNQLQTVERNDPTSDTKKQEEFQELLDDTEAACTSSEHLTADRKNTISKSKLPITEQPPKPESLRKSLFVGSETEANTKPDQINSSSEFEDSLNVSRFNAGSSSHTKIEDLLCQPSINTMETRLPRMRSEYFLDDTSESYPLLTEIPTKSDISLAKNDPSQDHLIRESGLLVTENPSKLDSDAYKVHASIVTSRLINRKRLSDPKDKAGSPPKKLRSQETQEKEVKKRPSTDRNMNRTVALRKAAAMAGSTCHGTSAKAKNKELSKARQYKAKGPMMGLPMAKLNLLKPSGTAIPRHPMPFAAKNMFYDERWMEKQERGFTRWLNYVLTPDDCPKDPSCKTTKIDAGTLCIDSASKIAVTLAPSKEDLSLRAYTAKRKLNRLRRGACMLFQSEPVIRVLRKLEAEIEKRRISVRLDRKLHADYGIKQQLLDLFLSYNPLWLRIGLETIYGEILPLQSNTDVIGLSRFVITRLLGNPDIAAQYAHPTVPHLYSPGYEEALSQFTLKKFLVLVFFLDRAKLTRLIDHDPCLFCKDSEFKSSRDILLHFSREYLRGEGDLTRHLSFMGYSVTHRQTALDEFDFSVVKLASDLRCGVRLARVAELLTQNWTLSSQLRVPAISRLQKIHNVEGALRAFQLDGGGVDARAVVDGHREKTLMLLWRIVFQFQIRLLLNEQQIKDEIAFQRKNLFLQKGRDALASLTERPGRNWPRRDSSEPNVYFKSERLSLLLKWCQVVCAFYGLKVENFTVAFSDGRVLCYLVHHYHSSILPLTLINQGTTQTQYQRADGVPDGELDDSFDGNWTNVYSPSTGKPEERDRLLANERENFKVLYDKVSELGGVPGVVKSAEMSNTIPDEKIVITYVSYLCARLLDLRTETRAARTIQLVWRGYRIQQLQKRRQMQEAAAQTIQMAVRRFLKRRHQQQMLRVIVNLQAMRRRVLACREVQMMKQARLELCRHKAAIKIQTSFRGYLARQHEYKTLKAIMIQSFIRGYLVWKKYQKTKRAIVTLQAAVRCHHARVRFQQLRVAVVAVQQRFRARSLGCKQRKLFIRQRRACIIIQAAFRGFSSRRMYLRKKSSAVRIQALVRGFLSRKKYVQAKSAAVVIQRYWRSNLHSKSIRKEYLKLHQAATVVQSFYRGMVGRRQAAFIRRVVKVQSIVRCFVQRRKYIEQLQACVLMQKSFRGYSARRRYKSIRAATLVLQQHVRARREGSRQLRDYNLKRGAVITLQAWARGIITRRQLTMTNQAAVRIQASWRMHQQRKKFLAIQAATYRLQKYTQAYLIRKKVHQDYLILRASTVLIQSRFRGVLARQKFLRTKASCILIQSLVRMHIERCRYKACQKAAVVLQRRFRAHLSRNHQLKAYIRQKAAAVILQTWFRGVLIRRQIATYQKAASHIQACFKAYRERRNYTVVRSATLCLQAHMRAYLVKKSTRAKFLKVRSAAVAIQSFHRGWKIRCAYLKQKEAAIKIQSAVRMYQASSRYVKLQTAVKVIQTRYRAQRTAYAVSIQYQTYRKACITLQAAARGFLTRRQMCKLHTAAIHIQSYYRAFSARTKYTRMRNAAMTLQTYWTARVLMRTAVQDFASMKKATVVLQSVYRGKLGRRIALKHYSARLIQSCYRMYCEQRRYQNQKKAAIQIQSVTRMHQARTRYMALRQAVVILQTRYRAQRLAQVLSIEYQIYRGACITLQAGIRGFLVRQEIRKLHSAATTIKKSYRCYKVQSRYKALKNAAEVLQKYWQATLEMRAVSEEFASFKEAAIILQSAYRGRVGRRVALQNRSARKIQSAYRMHLARKQYQRQKHAAAVIQSAFRTHQACRTYGELREATRVIQTRCRAWLKAQAVRQQFQHIRGACITLQAAARGYLVRKHIQQLHAAASLIQEAYRSHLVRQQRVRLQKAALVLQKHWRATILARDVRLHFISLKNAAVTLQSAYRGIRGRRVAMMHRAARTIQASFRMHLAQQEYQGWKRAAIRIQSVVRMYQHRSNYRALRQAVIKTQMRYRANKLAYMTSLQYQIKRSACLTLQAHVRGFLVRQQIQTLYKAAVTIQKTYRGYRALKKFSRLKDASGVLQKYWRATRMAREQKRSYSVLKMAAVTIQSMYRGFIGRRIAKEQRAARLIQSVYRMYHSVQEFNKQRDAAITIQSLYRMRKARLHYLRMTTSAVAIQQVFRGHLATQTSRKNFLMTRHAVTTIQAKYRGLVQRRKYVNLRQAAVKIQALYRGCRQRKEYQSMKWAAVVLQQRFRAQILRNRAFVVYNIQRGAALAIQAMYKSWVVRRSYIHMKQAVTIIQASFRGYRQRTNYLKMKRAVSCLQTRYRAHQLMREAVLQFQGQQQAAIKIQAVYRAHVARRRFNTIKAAAVVLQSCYRSRRERHAYQATRRAALVLQTRYRAHRLQQELTRSYRTKRKAVITIQAFRRGSLARKYVKRIRASVTIQSFYRGWLQRRHYRAVRMSVVLLQAQLRGMIARCAFASRKKEFQAAVCIQRYYRGFAARKTIEAQRRARLAQLERFSSVVHVHLSTIQIQRCYRMYRMRQAAKAKMNSIVAIQSWMRAKLQRLQFLKLRRGVVLLQRQVRKHQALQHQAAVCIQAWVRVWLVKNRIRKLTAAAITFQSVWRGRRVRRACKNKKIAAVRARCIKAAKAVTEEKRLYNRTTSALDYLLKYRHMSGLLEALISLDVVSRLSAACCKRLVESQAVPVIFTLIKSCNRSLPCMEVIKYSVNILLNLTKYPPTAHAVFDQPDSICNILDLMQMYREKGPQIFAKVCMLIGTLCQDPRRAQIVLSVPKNKDRLLSIRRLTERKYNMDTKRALAKSRGLNTSSMSCSFLSTSALNVSMLNASTLPATTPRKKQLRRVQPEWVLGRSKMREITDPLEACRFVMVVLQLK